ncbi:hypothetical protein NEOLEDRAFT_1179456 [Neolentinus lepideus HHB14362 ss-1]|uniref:Uncharacterized protein n=1 Tax=Neolentinus lepideus HHB14362 ss-1 TaxID=1314782 RepID=A0A165RSE1_9AGAM|nr:hypothetical protein NEOLEDRAFT_1179456 [Neolentinus lepideus HHB14362 ss-1]
MKFISVLLPLVLATFALAQGPCYNMADPDHGIGNYCYCEGNGLCYANVNGQCTTPGNEITCPE